MSISRWIGGLSPDRIRKFRLISKMIQSIMPVVDYIIPKNDKIIIFGSNGGEFESGSPSALYNYILKNDSSFHAYYYLPFRNQKSFWEKITYIAKFAPLFFRARYIVGSHPPSDFFPYCWWSRRKRLINMWHGFGPKAIFFADSDATMNDLNEVKKLSKKTYALIVSSKLEAAIFSRIFYIDPRKFAFLGQPRNDALVIGDTNHSPLVFINPIYNNSIKILYCPTYRRGKKTSFFPFEDFNLKQITDFLNTNNAVILLRGHPYEQAEISALFSERIIDCSFDVCNDVNSILSRIDILITDYSSIYVDFLLTDNRMIFIPYDIIEYEAGRGLLFDDYDDWTPGPKVKDQIGFMKALQDAISGPDSYCLNRERLRTQFHHYQSIDSSKRVLDMIRLIK